MFSWLNDNVGNSNVSYGTVALLVVVVVVTTVALNLAVGAFVKAV